ncbi:tax1-binding protein 1 homolog [Saccoglossus kowalevskii]|uniref:Tax1-binding protein 1 homolog n=1 Tax=Saccoglossus kowalevskii TaxID=10224 RepID=A0ABM0GYH6_SACKO|nr:PREDICTED: tax1-binding protein 1 homolog [Saccoglossus kowalevskii]
MNDTQEVTLDTERLEAKLTQEVTLDTEKLEAKLTSSDFAQVIFQNVAESYPPDADIICHYTLTESIVPSTSDWIGLFKVGWTSARGYHTFNYVQPPATQEGKQKTMSQSNIQFSAYYLPKEDGEFYQFVYVNKNGEKALSSSGAMEKEKSVFEARVKQMEIMLKENMEEKDALAVELAKLKDEMKQSEATLLDICNEKVELEKKIVELEEQIALYKDHFTTSEKENIKLKEEIETLRGQLSENDAALVKTKEDSIQLKSVVDEEKKKFERQLHVTNADKTHILSLEDKVKNYEDKIAALEDTKKLVTTELETLRQVQQNLSTNLEDKTGEVLTMKTKFKRQKSMSAEKEAELQEEIRALRDGLTQLAKEKEKLVNEVHTLGKQQEGPLYALQEANKHMRQKYNKLKKQHEGCVKERSELVTKQVAIELQNSDLTREIEDLRERLNMGAEAWKEKYKECQKLTTKIKKIKRKSVTTESDALQGAVAIATKESGVQAADSEQEESYNSMLHVQLNDLAKALEERNEQCKRYEEILQSEKTNMEKTEMKVLELDEKYQDSVKRYADAEKELNELKKKIKEAKRQNEAQEVRHKDDVATEFHDAQEFPADRAARWCPECNLLFPPSCPSDTFEQHVQSHFGRVCPMCRKQFPKDSCDQDAFENHVQTHFERE